MTSINLLIRINASLEETFAALSNNEKIASWFTETECDDWTAGSAVTWFGETKMTIREIHENEKVAFHVNSGSGWEGTDIVFSTQQIESDRTLVRFDHEGWTNITDHFRDCAMSWAYFLESLRLYLETGRGTPEELAPKCEAT